MATDKLCEVHRREIFYRRIFSLLLAFVVAGLIAVLVVWLILRPTKPRFAIQDATMIQINVTSPNTLTSTFQVSVYSRNPNDRIGIHYNQLQLFALYRNQQITLPSVIPSFYQGHKDVDNWSPFLSGVSVPVSPSLCFSLEQDKKLGSLMITLKMYGSMRWKVGS